MQKLSVQAPPKILVENYMIGMSLVSLFTPHINLYPDVSSEIAKSHNIPYEPDPKVMSEEVTKADEAIAASVPEKPALIDFGLLDQSAPGAVGPIPAPILPVQQASCPAGFHQQNPPIFGFNLGPAMPPYPMGSQSMDQKPAVNPNGGVTVPGFPPEKSDAFSASAPPTGPLSFGGGSPPHYDSIMGSNNGASDAVNNQQQPPHAAQPPVVPQNTSQQQSPVKPGNSGLPTPAPRSTNRSGISPFPDLPDVPTDSPIESKESPDNKKEDDIDFDDLAKRFEDLKRRK